MGLGIKTKYFQALEATLGARTHSIGSEAKKKLLASFDRTGFTTKPASDQIFTTIIGEANLSEFEISLFSLHQASGTLPVIIVHTDLKTSATQVTEALSWWPGSLTVKPAAQVLDEARDISPLLPEFAHAHRHGLKFCACAVTALRHTAIYSDSDVLWFRDWSCLCPPTEQASTIAGVRMSLDLARNYSPELTPYWNDFAKLSPLNSGIMHLQGNLFEQCDLHKPIQAATAHPDDFFGEQTLFAIACSRLGRSHWPIDQVHLSRRGYLTGAVYSHPHSAILRHYPGKKIRSLFWIDGLQLAQDSDRIQPSFS